MEMDRENLGRRIVELARIATAMHLQQALTLASRGGMPAEQRRDRLDLDSEVGGAGRRARASRPALHGWSATLQGRSNSPHG
ncbi:MAG TPA: hypothetical protein VH370_22115 [Humisphaera sp.]|jgi:hypothetical protein|nr:hypothetical protein [Humisphaera sp.]